MKQLMLGNEAVARGLYEAGVPFCFQLSRNPQYGNHGKRRQISGAFLSNGRPTRR